MAWVKIDDQAPRNAKLRRAGPSAAWMWVCGIAHCQAQMTGGFIPDISVPDVGVQGTGRSRKLAEVLVTCGLFERVDGGYMVHDYLEHNATREEAIARKITLGAKRAAAGRKGGLAKVANAKQTVVANSSPDPTRPDLTKNISQTLFVPKRDDCTYCGATAAQTRFALELDHFRPRAAGGTDDPENLLWACHPCNQAKSSRVFETVDDCRQWLHRAYWTSNRKRWIAHRPFAFGGRPPIELVEQTPYEWVCPHEPKHAGRNECRVATLIEQGKAS